MTAHPVPGRWLTSLRGRVSAKGVFLSVVAVVVTVLVLYPPGWLVAGSFLGERAVTGSGADAFQGYAALFSEMELVRNSAVVGVGSTVVAVVLGVSLAWITTRTNILWRGALDKLVLVPFFITPLLGAVGWAILASPGRGGLLNNIIASTFGLDEGPLNVYTPWGIIFVTGIYYGPSLIPVCCRGLAVNGPSPRGRFQDTGRGQSKDGAQDHTPSDQAGHRRKLPIGVRSVNWPIRRSRRLRHAARLSSAHDSYVPACLRASCRTMERPQQWVSRCFWLLSSASTSSSRFWERVATLP